uniref:Rx N-terminal domain-containing protein n=2 Tax=Aegilops tauschii subsp. strangulata TaxID=200361 RepID=A0A453CZN6_AEGTS
HLMEAAIAWLVETILATLLIDKLDAWIRQAGLADDIEKLKSEIRRIKMVISALKGRGIRKEALAESLALLEDHLYVRRRRRGGRARLLQAPTAGPGTRGHSHCLAACRSKRACCKRRAARCGWSRASQ